MYYWVNGFSQWYCPVGYSETLKTMYIRFKICLNIWIWKSKLFPRINIKFVFGILIVDAFFFISIKLEFIRAYFNSSKWKIKFKKLKYYVVEWWISDFYIGNDYKIIWGRKGTEATVGARTELINFLRKTSADTVWWYYTRRLCNTCPVIATRLGGMVSKRDATRRGEDVSEFSRNEMNCRIVMLFFLVISDFSRLITRLYI